MTKIAITFLAVLLVSPAAHAQGPGGPMMGGPVPNLKVLAPGDRVQAISYCGDTYRVTTGDGKTREFQERNLRFKTDLRSGWSGARISGPPGSGHVRRPRPGDLCCAGVHQRFDQIAVLREGISMSHTLAFSRREFVACLTGIALVGPGRAAETLPR